MKGVFADTVGILALWDDSDQWHSLASLAYQKLIADNTALWTTTFVLLELANAASQRPYRQAVDRFRNALWSDGTLIIPSDEDWNGAWAAYARGDAESAGVVDPVSFIVMRRLKLTHVLGNDRHFRSAGFQTVL